MTYAAARCARRTLIALLLIATAMQAHAQDTRAQREREALRRAQALVQQTQAELNRLRAENEAVLQQKDAALGQEQELQGKLAAARRDNAALRADVTRLRSQQAADLKQLTQARSDDAAAAQQRQQELQRELAEQRRERENLVRLNGNLVARLEQRTADLADMRQRNAALHALALEAVERYRLKSTWDMAHQDDPIFGLSRVRTESSAEDLRIRIDAQRSAQP
jgi:chromosome segregation ATPase